MAQRVKEVFFLDSGVSGPCVEGDSATYIGYTSSLLRIKEKQYEPQCTSRYANDSTNILCFKYGKMSEAVLYKFQVTSSNINSHSA
jgi:hypothetical protein